MTLKDWIRKQLKINPTDDMARPSTSADMGASSPGGSRTLKGMYMSDSPLVDPGEDEFDRAQFAKRIAETIGSKIDPSSIVIGLYGPWGDGKTTVLNFVQTELNCFNSVICFKFNPWRFEDEWVLLNTFFETLASVLSRRLSTNREEIGKALSRYGGVLSSAGKALKSTLDMAGMGLPTLPVSDLGDAAANLGAVLSGASLEELRKRIDDILAAEAKRVIVIMDDIDRLEKTEKNQPRALVIADSAEPKSIAEIKSYGINILPAQKGADSVTHGIQLVQEQRISVTKRSVNILREYKNYAWMMDKEGNSVNEPNHVYSHSMDAIRYAIESLTNAVFTVPPPTTGLVKPFPGLSI